LNSHAVVEFGRDQVEAIVDRSLMRLGVEKLDLVQLRWPGSDHPGCLDALAYLSLMQARGKIGYVGLAHFDHHHLRMFMDAGVDIAAIKVPYSLVDRRCQGAMTAFCHENDIAVIASDVLVGGFLLDDWLGAADPYNRIGDPDTLESRQIIEAFGGWSLLQELLMALQSIATRHGTTIEDIALRAIYDHADPASMALDSSRIVRFVSRLETKKFAPTERDREVLSAVLRKRRAITRTISGNEQKAIDRKASVVASKLRVRSG
jgi:aryl-alcohol dehydrogenase-like predicted oxidoreductase